MLARRSDVLVFRYGGMDARPRPRHLPGFGVYVRPLFVFALFAVGDSAVYGLAFVARPLRDLARREAVPLANAFYLLPLV